MQELKTPEQFAQVYEAQINIGNLYHTLLELQHPNKKLIESLKHECIVLAEELGGGYFWDAHWLKEPLATGSAYHLYCLQIVKE